MLHSTPIDCRRASVASARPTSLDERAFGDLQLQLRRLEPGLVENLSRLRQRNRGHRTAGGDVDAHEARRQAAELPLPCRHLPARLRENEPAELPDHAGVFGDRNELRGADRAARSGWCQRASASKPLMVPRAERDDRLVEDGDLLVVDRVPQIGLELQARHRALAHGRVEELVGRRAAGLGAVQRDRRILQHLFRPLVAGRADGDADRRPT